MLKPSKIKPFLWFEDQAEEAAKFYTSVFRNAKIGKIARFPEGSPRPAGMVMTVEFTLEGHEFVALNGGSQFKFTEAVSNHLLDLLQQTTTLVVLLILLLSTNLKLALICLVAAPAIGSARS